MILGTCVYLWCHCLDRILFDNLSTIIRLVLSVSGLEPEHVSQLDLHRQCAENPHNGILVVWADCQGRIYSQNVTRHDIGPMQNRPQGRASEPYAIKG